MSSKQSTHRTYDVSLFPRERICRKSFTLSRNSRIFGDYYFYIS